MKKEKKEKIQRPVQKKSMSTAHHMENEGENKGLSIMPPPLQFKSITGKEEEKKSPVQKKSNSNGMPENVQTKMENAFGHDFSNVNVHTNSSSSKDMGALAYAQGNDIHFASGQYNPQSQKGQELIGHELTHVVQQREGRVKPTTKAKGVAVNDDKKLEKEADDMGRKSAGTNMVQQKSVQNKTAGNIVQKQDASIALQVAAPTGVCTEFGDFTIYPDSFIGPLPVNSRDDTSWNIRRSQYNLLISRVTSIKNATGKLTVTGTASFKTRTYLDLAWLLTSGVGRSLIDGIQSSSHNVSIQERAGGNATGYGSDDSYERNTTPPTPGTGSNATVYYNPNVLQIGDGSASWMTRPPAIGLAHELIHAWTGVKGTRARGNDTDGNRRRELQATGLGEFRNAVISENRFRAAFGLPRRTEY